MDQYQYSICQFFCIRLQRCSGSPCRFLQPEVLSKNQPVENLDFSDLERDSGRLLFQKVES